MNREFGKMGKSLKNIITPDDMYDTYGADTFRLYEMSMGPLDESRPWNTRNVIGSMRFLQRLWRNAVDENTGQLTVTDAEADEKTRKLVNRPCQYALNLRYCRKPMAFVDYDRNVGSRWDKEFG